MIWYLVFYWVHKQRYDFACVRDVYRRGAYLEVAAAMSRAIVERHGSDACWTWDTEELMDDTQRNEETMDEAAETSLNGYQMRANTTAAYPGRHQEQIIYPVIAMCEESGELAGAVLNQLKQNRTAEVRASLGAGQPIVAGEYTVTEAALELASAYGVVMGLIKKAFRNDPQGELTHERTVGLQAALAETNRALLRLASTVQFGGRVEFPPVSVPVEDRDRMVKEVGDVLWYVACFCTEVRVSLGYVGDTNYAKLADRAKRDVIRGTGDNR